MFPKGESKHPVLSLGLQFIIPVIVSADLAAIYGGQARTLQLPFAWLAERTMLLCAVVFFVVGIVLRWIKRLQKFRWEAAFLLALVTMGFPVWLVKVEARPIALRRPLTANERTTLKTVFSHPHLEYSASGEPHCLLIRKKDWEPQLIEFLKSIGAVDL